MQKYSYEEIRDCAIYIVDRYLDNNSLLKEKKLIVEQLNVFENLLLEAITPIKGREQGIYCIVCSDMIWQVVRNILNYSDKENIPQKYKSIMEKANEVFSLHSFIRHPAEDKLQKYGWILNRTWTTSEKELVRNIAQIIYKIVMTIHLSITH